MTRIPLPIALLAAALLIPFAPLSAQRTTASIAGVVLDGTGGAVSEAQVSATLSSTGARREVLTDAEGRYLIARLPVGTYELRVVREGYQTVVRQGIELTVSRNALVDFDLSEGEQRFEVTVVDDAPLVDTQSHELSYLVDSRSIEELPINGRNYLDLALLQPGVQAYRNRDSGGSGSIVAKGLATSINGQSPRSNVYLLDGTLQNDFTNGPAGSGAGTSLGMETIREFRVETNAYSAEFGRSAGGQINALTKSGTNELHGSIFWFLRNDNLDARNFFDPEELPEFRRNQYGSTVGGPIVKDKTFFFFGSEVLREDLGRTIQSFTPNAQARQGLLPDPETSGLRDVGVSPGTAPYLNEYPIPNGPDVGGGIGIYTFGANQELEQDFYQGRIDHQFSSKDSFFARYTYDDAQQTLPTDYPQFPRFFVSRNQFLTLEHTRIVSPSALNTLRASFSRTNFGQDVSANTANFLEPFVPGLPSIGQIDVPGLPRFGTQTSANVNFAQNVFSFQDDFFWTLGRHAVKAGALVERYQNNLFNPTFSRGIFFFPSLEGFLRNTPIRYIGLTPESTVDRYWRSTMLGFYAQDDFRVAPRLTLNLGLRYEYMSVPTERQGRDSALPDLFSGDIQRGQVYENPTGMNFAPRIGFAYDVFGGGKTALRGGYGIFYNTNLQHQMIVTVVNPPAASRPVIGGPTLTFPNPAFGAARDRSIRPIQYDLESPYVQVWNLNVQQQLPGETVLTVGYAGSRGIHLLRNTDFNLRQPTRLDDGSYQYSAASPRLNPNFALIELKKSDGRSWYNAMILDLRKRFSGGLQLQSSYTFSRSIDTGQDSVFFSDSVSGTTTTLPELPGFEYNKGLSDFHAKHNWVTNFLWDVPFPESGPALARRIFGGWQAGGILTLQSGTPLTSMVQRNRSLSGFNATVGAGRGLDRPQLAQGFTHESAVLGEPDGWFDPNAFELQPAGRLGALGRNTFIGPNLQTFDFSLTKQIALTEDVNLQFRSEFFNLLNRANFGAPGIVAFAGTADSNPVLGAFGRVRRTVTTSRQIQFGLRLGF